jgi:DNA-binding NtrC family response regulator
LRHTIERAAMLAEGPWLRACDLQGLDESRREAVAPPLRVVRRIDDLEREAIEVALANTRGNKKEAARRLGISRRALYRRLEKFGLDRRAA